MSEGIDFPGYGAGPGVQPLAIQRFETGAWRSVASLETDARLETLRVVTYNTWFQGANRELRYAGLLDALNACGADMIMLQEATVQLLEALTAADWVRSRYCFVRAPFRSDAIPSHGLMLLSRLPLHSVQLHPLPTHMGRALLLSQARINGRGFAFATTHLESMKPYADVRARQLATAFALLEAQECAIFAGDFNFCSSWQEENSRIDRRYVDVWPAARPGEPGFTQDTDSNRMLAMAKRETKRVRIDRVLLRSEGESGRWLPESAALLGTGPVSPKHPDVFPSDHFGVMADFRYTDRG